MKTRALCSALLALLLLGSAPPAAADELAPAAPAPTVDHYVAIGVRTYAADPTSLALSGKARLLALGPVSASGRAALLLGRYTEVRAPMTVELQPVHRVAPFLGIGVAYNTDQLGALDPMLTGGVDVALHRRVALNVTVHYIRQIEAADDDKELMVSLALVL